MLKLWEILNAPSLPPLPGRLKPGVEAPLTELFVIQGAFNKFPDLFVPAFEIVMTDQFL